MERVLDTYDAGHDPERPLIGMDEAAKPMTADAEGPIAMAPGRPAKEDDHYGRRGVRAIFLSFDPIRGWRRTTCRDSRTRVDRAEEVRRLLDEDYPLARKVKLVCDNLDAHSIASLYEAFPAGEARRLARRLEIIHTPRSGSWLNVAEIERSIPARQGPGRRIGSEAEVDAECARWRRDRDADGGRVAWRFTTEEARIKPRHLYPQC